MKHLKPFLLLGICFLSIFSLSNCSAQKASSASGKKAGSAGATVVYLVRHAEKAPSSGAMTDDPDLSETGLKRAEALKTQLASAPIAAFFATKYKRTQQTLAPLASAKKQTVQLYEVKDNAALVQKIKQEYPGKTVVVAGHSNTLLPLVEAFGGTQPFAEIADHQYDYLFKVTLQEGKAPVVDVQKYGAASVAPAN